MTGGDNVPRRQRRELCVALRAEPESWLECFAKTECKFQKLNCEARIIMADHIVVETVSGKLRGIVQNGIRIFKGIPSAGPVEGAGRFMPPAKSAPWTGVRDALEFSPRPIQPDQPHGLAPERI